jgi:hypothetical protein
MKKALEKRVMKRLIERQGQNVKRYFSCLPPTLELQFRKSSLMFEKAMFALTESQLTEAELREAELRHLSLFQEAKLKGKFCEIDPERVLEDEGWRSFFLHSNIY